MRLALAVFALALAPAVAVADEEYDATKSPDPCADAKELEQSIRELGEQIEVMIAEAKRTCKHKALAKECARQKLEIESQLQAMRNMNAMRKAAEAECKKRSGQDK